MPTEGKALFANSWGKRDSQPVKYVPGLHGPGTIFLILLQVCVGSFYKFGIHKPCFILPDKKRPFTLHR